jgi:hypothetical protein
MDAGHGDIGQDAGWKRRGVLTGVAAVATLVFILTQLTGGDSDLQLGRTLTTAYVMVIFTIMGTVGAALARSQPRFALLGVATAMLALLAFGALVASTWTSDHFGLFGFGFAYGGTSAEVGDITLLLAVLAAAASALLLLRGAEEDGSSLLVALAGIGALVVVAGLGILAIVDSGVDVSERVYAIAATVYVVAGALLFLFRLLPSERPALRP